MHYSFSFESCFLKLKVRFKSGWFRILNRFILLTITGLDLNQNVIYHGKSIPMIILSRENSVKMRQTKFC